MMGRRTGREPLMSGFENLHVLKIDTVGHGARLLRRILKELAVENFEVFRSAKNTLPRMRKQRFDVVFCDDSVGFAQAVAFVKALRRDINTCDPTVPVFLLTAGLCRSDVEIARDAGINDVITKPVSIETIRRKLESVLLNPSAFVAAKTFLGPDRRRSSERQPYPREDRRAGRSADAEVFIQRARITLQD
jgi:two-component system, chemotaxis family, chemotaxis protein CheY